MGSALEIALSGMRAAQAGMAVSAHNVANVSVEGYTRQRIQFKTNTTLFGEGTLANGGVNAEAIQRMSDRFVSRQIRDQVAERGYHQTLSEKLAEVEATFNQRDDQGLNAAFNQLFSDLAQLTVDPDVPGVRSTTVTDARVLTDILRQSHRQLTTIDRENRLEIDYQIGRANSLLSDLGRLNGLIAGGVESGRNVSDLMDQRDRSLQEIAELTGARIYVQQDESEASVTLSGISMVLGSSSLTLAVDSGGLKIAETGDYVTLGAGKLAALLEYRDEIIPRYRDELDDLAVAVRDSFNAVHRTGYGLDGSTGLDLFTGTDAGDLNVNAAILADHTKLAASSDGDPGDSGGASALLAIRDQAVLGSQTLEQFFESMIGSIGSETRAAGVQTAGLDSIVTDLLNRRDSVNGVSIDEEMANLIQFQQAYAAAARIVSVVDEMTQTLLQRL